MKTARNFLARLWADERGVSSVEYALLLALAAGGIMMSAGELGIAVSGEVGDATECMNSSGASC